MQPFTRNFDDASNEVGFQFTFYCDICHDGYKTNFMESKLHKKAGFFRTLGAAASLGGSLLGSGLGSGIGSGTDAFSQRFRGMSPEWHKEHEAAFEKVQEEAKGHFSRCARCKRYVCKNDWNEQEGLCVEDAPRESVEVAAAKAEKMVRDIREKAGSTQIFDGEIATRQTICPKCGKPSGQGKFCTNCGSSLDLVKCLKCGAQSPSGTKFCGQCGSGLG